MAATEGVSERRRGRRTEEPAEVQEAPAPIDPPAEVTAEKRRRSPRRPDGQSLDVRIGSSRKLTIQLPIQTWWRLKHHLADRPDLCEGEVIAPLLDQYLATFDYPKRPDWLMEAMGKAVSTQEVSAN